MAGSVCNGCRTWRLLSEGGTGLLQLRRARWPLLHDLRWAFSPYVPAPCPPALKPPPFPPRSAQRIAFYAIQQSILGMAIFCAIELFIFPRHAATALRRQAALTLRQASFEYGALWDAALAPPPPAAAAAVANAAPTTTAGSSPEAAAQEPQPAQGPSPGQLLRRAGGAAMLLQAGIARQRVLAGEAASEPNWCA